MSKRRDNKGRILRSGESQKKNGRYVYQYTDFTGNRRCVYSNRLEKTDSYPTDSRKREPSLREKEKEIKDKLEQKDGRRYSSIHNVRGVVRPAFQMAVDDDLLPKNPFDFHMSDILYDDTEKRQALTPEQEAEFLCFIWQDGCCRKYYEVIYILLNTGLRISEFCGLTLKDLDMENRVIDINHQLQRASDMSYNIEPTKTNAGTRRLPMTDDVYECFKTILENRPRNAREIMVDGYMGFLFLDKNGMPEVAMHWEHRFNHAVHRYNDIFRVQMPNITPHVCRHTYCSNMAKSGMSPKTLQYLMGHSEIGVTMNVYTHLGLEDAKEEMIRMEELNAARAELNKTTGEKPVTQKMFRAI